MSLKTDEKCLIILEFGLRFNFRLGIFWGTSLSNVRTTTRPNSSQLFPNLEATCNILLFLSTPLPQGTKLSGLLKL